MTTKKLIQTGFLMLIVSQSSFSSATSLQSEERSLLIAGSIVAGAYLATLLPNAYEWYLLQAMSHKDAFDYVRIFHENNWAKYKQAAKIAHSSKIDRAKQHELLDYIYDSNNGPFRFVYYVQDLDYALAKSAKYLTILQMRLALLQLNDQSLTTATDTVSLAHGYKLLIRQLQKLLTRVEPVKTLITGSYSYQDQLYAYQLEQYG